MNSTWDTDQYPLNRLKPETLAYLQTLEPTKERKDTLLAMEPEELERRLHTAMIRSMD